MPSDQTARFMEALQQAEAGGDVEPLVALFAEDAELSNLAHDEPARGVDGARAFWAEYLRAFEGIRSTFHHVLEGDSGAALEWVSEGTRRGGHPLSYRGISVLEFRDGLVRTFRTYYDSAAFTAPNAGMAAGGATSSRGA